jgi:hypothetical protein
MRVPICEVYPDTFNFHDVNWLDLSPPRRPSDQAIDFYRRYWRQERTHAPNRSPKIEVVVLPGLATG